MESSERLKVPLCLRRVISSYLENRTLLYDTDDGMHSYKITGDMRQGSVLGPPGWNFLYDGLLRQPLPEGAPMVAFADDVVLIVIAKSIEEIQHLVDEAIEVVASWLTDHGLSLAAEKTEAVLIS